MKNEVTVGRDYLEAQLKNEYALRNKVDGAINALEGMLKLIDQEEARGGEAAAEQCGADQQPQAVQEQQDNPEGDPRREDAACPAAPGDDAC